MLKKSAQLLSLLITLPFSASFILLKQFSNERRSYPFFSQLFSLIPGLPGEYLRCAFYKQTLEHCGDDCCISFGTIFSTSQASLGKNVYIGPYCILGSVSIGDDTLLASRVSVTSGKKQHGIKDLETPIREQEGVFKKVTIGFDCWIGEGAIICADVGERSVVGSGSVVVEPVNDAIIVGGNPASFIRKR